MTSTPIFAGHHAAYLDAGWSGILPLPPHAKHAPPAGYTGADGRWPTRHDIDRWAREQPDGNIALRLPRDVIGVDLDLYRNADARNELERLCGPLPPTWCSTSRVDGSGIRFYRVPPPPAGTVWQSAPVPGVEIVQHHHRYAVVWPSIHPEGREYLWVDETSGEISDRPPEIDELTELPWAAIAALAHTPEAATQRAPVELELPAGDMSVTVERRLHAAVAATKGERGSRHDAACRDVTALMRLAERGEPGVERALALLEAAFVAQVGPDRAKAGAAEREFDDIVNGARRLVASTVGRIPTRAERDAEWQRTRELAIVGERQVLEHAAEAAAADVDDTVELDELLGTPDEPYDWLIEGLVERGDRVILTGLEGRGKSTFLRQFAVKAASGIHPFDDSAQPPLQVLYVDLENSRRQVRRKVGELRAAAGGAYDGRLRFTFRPEGIDLTRTPDVAWLATVIGAHRPDLVVIGPIYKMATGDPKDEQTARVVSTVLDQLRTTHQCALLIEAHTPYADGAKSKRPERPYGASLWSRWPEFGIYLGPEGDLLHWRGQRDERAWPRKVERGQPWPWMVTSDGEEAADREQWEGPTHCIRDIVELLAATPGVEYSVNALTTALRARGAAYKDKTIRFAAESAAVQRLVHHRSGPRNARLYSHLVQGETAVDVSTSPLFDDRGPPRPTAAHRGPAAVEVGENDRGRPRPTTPYGVGPRAAVVSPPGAHDNDDRGPAAVEHHEFPDDDPEGLL